MHRPTGYMDDSDAKHEMVLQRVDTARLTVKIIVILYVQYTVFCNKHSESCESLSCVKLLHFNAIWQAMTVPDCRQNGDYVLV